MSDPMNPPARDDREHSKVYGLLSRLKEDKRRLTETVAELLGQKASDVSNVFASLQQLGRERDEWKAKALAAPGEQAARIKELEGQVRYRDHKDAFAAVLKDDLALAPTASVEELWGKLKYTPGETLPSPDQIKEQVTAAKDTAGHLFRPAEVTSATPPARSGPRPPLSGGIGSGRGEPGNGSATFRTTNAEIRERINEPGFQKQYREALASKTLVVEG